MSMTAEALITVPRRPHLNFITGENGSGKSATLQCLQVCLGARARDTGRSTAAKGLINDEASSANARTVLWNTVRLMQQVIYATGNP